MAGDSVAFVEAYDTQQEREGNMAAWLIKIYDVQTWEHTFDEESDGVIAVAVYLALAHVGLFEEG